MRNGQTIGFEKAKVIQPGSYLNYLTAADLIVTKRCPEDCDFCWELDPREDTGNQRLLQVSDTAPVWDADPAKVDAFMRGCSPLIKKIVFTGGEPDVYRPLADRLRVARETGRYAVISTSGLSPKQFAATMQHASRYEVAIDGPPEVHERSRRGSRLFGNSGSFDKAVDTILRAQAARIPLGIRTLVNADTVETVPQIPQVLADYGVVLTRHVRMKLYQQAPVGPRAALMKAEGKDISTSKLLQTVLRLRLERPEVCVYASPWRQATHRGAYVQPNGEAYTILIDPDTGLPQEVPLGNAYAGNNPSTNFAGAKARRLGYLLMDRTSRTPFNLGRWSSEAMQGEHDDWLAMDKPTPIAYEQPVDNLEMDYFNTYGSFNSQPPENVTFI